MQKTGDEVNFMGLTKEQLDAIKENSGIILVKAGAGTGKTEVLTRRIIYLLEQDPTLSINEMAIITFTNKATENILSRLKEYLYQKWKYTNNPQLKLRFRYELEGLNSAQICTIHKFCKNILDEIGPIYSQDFQYSPNFSVSSGSLYQAIDDAIELWIKENEENGKEILHLEYFPVYKLKEVIKNAYIMLKTKGLNLNKVLKQTIDQSYFEINAYPRKIKKELIEVITKISQLHSKYKLQTLDTDDLLAYCAKVLYSNKGAREKIKQKYKHLLVDEFQDTSSYQTEIIKALDPGNTGPNLFAVGDGKQSIYKFRGADLNSYSRFEKSINNEGKILSLRTNFRSSPELVTMVNLVFQKVSEEKEKYSFNPESLIPKIDQKELDIYNAFEWLLSPSSEKESEITANYIKEQLENGVNPQKIAVLFRRNYEMEKYYQVFIKEGIPCKMVDSGDLYNQREIVDLHKIFNLLLTPNSKIAYEEALDTIYFNYNIEQLNNFLNGVATIYIEKMTPAQVINYIYRNVEKNIIGRDNKRQIIANLNKIKQITRQFNIKENFSLEKFNNWLGSMIYSHNDETLGDFIFDEENVTLMTIHKAKGLEFPIVILPELDRPYGESILEPPVIYNEDTGLEFNYKKHFDKNITCVSEGYENAIKQYKKDHFSEELRVLYVALTRAKEKLILVGSKDCQKSIMCFQNWIKL